MTAMQEKIVRGAVSGRLTLQSCSDIAYKAGVATSTVRRHMDALIKAGWLRHTSYVGLYSPSPQARDKFPPGNLDSAPTNPS